MPPSSVGARALADLCQKAGCSIDDLLLLEEKEFIQLSKDICGNGILAHAQVYQQWRHARMAALVRQEAMSELERNGIDEEPQEQEEVNAEQRQLTRWELELQQWEQQQEQEQQQQPIKPASVRGRAPQQQQRPPPLGGGVQQFPKDEDENAMGSDWDAYLRKQIRKEVVQLEDDMSRDDDVPRVIRAEERSRGQGDDASTYFDDYSTVMDEDEYTVATVATTYINFSAISEAVVDLVDTGMKAFFLEDPPAKPKKTKKVSPKAVQEVLDDKYEVVLKKEFQKVSRPIKRSMLV